MKKSLKKEIITQEIPEEENKNTDLVSSDEENSENEDQVDSPKMNIASFITTPYERVLSIINEAKTFILSVSSTQQELIKGLEWAIKVISSHNLYAYELKDQESSKENEQSEDFKQFVQFVNSYNDVIPTNKKQTGKGKSFLISSLNLKRPSALKYNLHKVEEEKEQKNEEENADVKNSKNNEEKNINSTNKINTNNSNHKLTKSFQKLRNAGKDNKKIDKLEKNESSRTQKINKNYKSNKRIKPISPIRAYKKNFIKNILAQKLEKEEKSEKKLSQSLPKNISQKEKELISPKPQKILKTFNRLKSENIGMKNISSSYNALKKEKSHNVEKISLNKSFTKYSSNLLENALIDINYPPSRIIEKTFNIFELKEIIGQDNVLPIMGKVILDSFGLYSDDIISTEKLDPFLVSISNQYYKTTLYHNSMHGADVTQSLCLYFQNSNAEEICQSLVLDLLGILIAALGHDLGHPGLTNPFHINSSSELAITYNDVSCLENFHASKLFRTIRNPETDIFEKLSVQDYKTIRKRMIGNILATDMANHGKIMTVIKSRIAINKAENKTKFELLSNEFWLQGDKEKEMKLPVSFLCDRVGYNITNSPVGFIKGFILPTFPVLIIMFSTLNYPVEIDNTNIHSLSKLVYE